MPTRVYLGVAVVYVAGLALVCFLTSQIELGLGLALVVAGLVWAFINSGHAGAT